MAAPPQPPASRRWRGLNHPGGWTAGRKALTDVLTGVTQEWSRGGMGGPEGDHGAGEQWMRHWSRASARHEQQARDGGVVIDVDGLFRELSKAAEHEHADQDARFDFFAEAFTAAEEAMTTGEGLE